MNTQQMLDQLIAKRSENAINAYKKLVLQGEHLNDTISHANLLEYKSNGKLKMGINYKDYDIHDHALYQIAERYNIPIRYVKFLYSSEPWKKQLLETVLNEHTNNINARYLVRTVEDQVRGFLSSQYKRLNSVQIYSTFVKAGANIGAKVINAYTSDTRGYVEMVMPQAITITTPNNGTHDIAFGARLRNSDFGDGALQMSLFTIRIICSNGMVGRNIFREVHKGGILDKDEILSERTYKLDTARTVSLVDDYSRWLFSEELKDFEINKIINSSKNEINIKKEIEHLPKIGMMKSEIESVEQILMGDNEHSGTQGKPTSFKLANAISNVAELMEDRRQRDLQEIAGKMLAPFEEELPKPKISKETEYTQQLLGL